MSKMSIYRFNYGLTDFMKILSYKKECPACGSKIKHKSDKKEYVETD